MSACGICGGFDYRHDPVAHGEGDWDDDRAKLAETDAFDAEQVRRLILDALIDGNGTHDCPACNCTGALRDKRTCPLCDGWGYL